MPRPFTPDSREAVIETADGISAVFQAAPCGQGVLIAYRSESNTKRMFTRLMEEHGWFVASFEARETGDEVLLMPVTEVPA